MARLSSWLSQDVIHALGWALIHSLWQCVGLAALAAIVMALARRPTVRYLIGAAALALMLAAPAATFLLLLKPAVPARALYAAPQAAPPRHLAVRMEPTSAMPAADATFKSTGGAISVSASKNLLSPQFLSPKFLSPKLLPWLVMAWLLGVALFSLRFAGGLPRLSTKPRRWAWAALLILPRHRIALRRDNVQSRLPRGFSCAPRKRILGKCIAARIALYKRGALACYA